MECERNRAKKSGEGKGGLGRPSFSSCKAVMLLVMIIHVTTNALLFFPFVVVSDTSSEEKIQLVYLLHFAAMTYQSSTSWTMIHRNI